MNRGLKKTVEDRGLLLPFFVVLLMNCSCFSGSVNWDL